MKKNLAIVRMTLGKTQMMQEMVGSANEEYIVSAFEKNSDLRAMISLKRKLPLQGYTEIAEVVGDIEISPPKISYGKVIRYIEGYIKI